MTPLMAFLRAGRFIVMVTTPASDRSTMIVSYDCDVMTGDDTGAMGFNPFRPQRRTAADYLMVIGALVAVVALVLWAFLG